MVKIVINKTLGGFGLSKKGEAHYLNLQGKTAYFYKQTKYKHSDGKEEYTRVDVAADTFFVHTLLVDLGETVDKLEYKDAEYFYSGDIARDDPLLVQTVEALGADADGDCASLVIVEVPDDVQWEIEEYDGNEHVAEKRRTWG